MSDTKPPPHDAVPDKAHRNHAMPLPHNVQTMLLLGIFTILVLYTLYFTSEIFVPVIFAVILNLVLQPAMRFFARFRVPKAIAAFLIIAIFFGFIIELGVALSGPAAGWFKAAPESLHQLEMKLSILKKPFDAILTASNTVDNLLQPATPGTPSVTVGESRLSSSFFSGTRTTLVGMATMLVLLFFLLVSSDLFLRRLIEVLPRLHDKKRVVEIAHEIERNISAYLATITFMNLAVGLATGLAAFFCGLSDPVLWGALAFMLNYVPIIGPLCGIFILLVAGFLSFDTTFASILPAAIYLVIHLAEGEIVTPMLLARRFVLNPVLVIMSLIFWYWMWGVPGALLAIPMLATFKIIADRVEPLMAFGHFLGGASRD
jgi:predicted PurR-regulated permease PerM